MNAKIWGAFAVALVLSACGGKKEEAAPAPEAAPAAVEQAATEAAEAVGEAATEAADEAAAAVGEAADAAAGAVEEAAEAAPAEPAPQQ